MVIYPARVSPFLSCQHFRLTQLKDVMGGEVDELEEDVG